MNEKKLRQDVLDCFPFAGPVNEYEFGGIVDQIMRVIAEHVSDERTIAFDDGAAFERQIHTE